jgi:hypothetical protein
MKDWYERTGCRKRKKKCRNMSNAKNYRNGTCEEGNHDIRKIGKGQLNSMIRMNRAQE